MNDLVAMKRMVKSVDRKFDGYAQKCKAQCDGLLLTKLDRHFFCPYPDLAFLVCLARRNPNFDIPNSFWLPRALVVGLAQ